MFISSKNLISFNLIVGLFFSLVLTINPIQNISADDKSPAACVPKFGTAQLPPGKPADNTYTGIDDLPKARNSLKLPKHKIYFRNGEKGFNRRYEIILGKDKNIYIRPTLQKSSWHLMPMPNCLNGTIKAVSINDDELVAIDNNNWIYTADNLLSSPRKWNWTSNFGSPFWFGGGQQTFETRKNKWSLSIIGTLEDKEFRDTNNQDHNIAFAKVTQVIGLNGNGSRITYLDPWLPNDYSFEVGSPKEGRFISESLSVSGSTLFVVNKYGDMFTRLYDFDTSGGDFPFFRYSWENQKGKPKANSQLEERINLSTAAIQLPAEEWKQQPKIPGKITSNISIHSTAAGSDNRELRVEGIKNGKTGYWYKKLLAKKWSFKATNISLEGEMLNNTVTDNSDKTLAKKQPYSYSSTLKDSAGKVWKIIIPNFDWAVTTQPIKVISPSGKEFEILLHKVDLLRQSPRNVGLDQEARLFDSAFQIIENKNNLELKAFKDSFMDGKDLKQNYISVTDSKIDFILRNIEMNRIIK